MWFHATTKIDPTSKLNFLFLDQGQITDVEQEEEKKRKGGGGGGDGAVIKCISERKKKKKKKRGGGGGALRKKKKEKKEKEKRKGWTRKRDNVVPETQTNYCMMSTDIYGYIYIILRGVKGCLLPPHAMRTSIFSTLSTDAELALHFSSGWYLWARKSPYALHPVSEQFPQCRIWSGSNARPIDDGPLSSFQRRSSSGSSFHTSLLQAIDGVMSLALYQQL